MADLDFEVLQNMDKRPFLIAPFTQTLVLGGVNHNPKRKPISPFDVAEALEAFLNEDGDITELFQDLMGELEKSSFFKSLQKGNQE
jgi:hypothetical protein